MLGREAITDALRFWEIARVPYNLVLLGVTAAAANVHIQTCPECGLQQRLGGEGLLELALWAVLANVAYCLAYLPDLFAQHAHFAAMRSLWRGAIWTVGTAFAGVLAWKVAWAHFYPW